MAQQRIKKGILPVKGVQHKCSVCGAMYDRLVAHSHRCEKCQSEYLVEYSRCASRRKVGTDEYKKYQRDWFKNKRQTDVSYRISQHFTVLIHRALGKKKAGRSWRTFVDYSLEELMVHLECQFLPGMTWENKGDWHIDHIIPRASFEYESPDDESFKQAWALSNLRPIWAIDNIRKNASRMFLL
jgi:hypothetical protein